MPELSAGLLMCRLKGSTQEYFLVHPGGPYYQNKNEGVWSIPKGLVNANEKMLECARREFAEETGLQPKGPFYALEHTRLKVEKQFMHGLLPAPGKKTRASSVIRSLWSGRRVRKRSFRCRKPTKRCGLIITWPAD